VDFNIPADVTAYLAELDAFIEKEIKPLERENDNIRFFDHRREWARSDTPRGSTLRKVVAGAPERFRAFF
jgi:acyl-CoA dehydrogenase